VSNDVQGLAEEYFEIRVETDPLMGSLFGIPGTADKLPALDVASQLATAARLRALEVRLAEIAPGEQDVVTRDVLAYELAARAAALESGISELSISGLTSPQGQLFMVLPKTLPSTSESDYRARLEQVDGYLQQAAERFRDAAKSGRTASRHAVEQAIGQLDAYLCQPVDPFTTPFPGSDAVGRTVADRVRPAFARFRDVLAGELLAGTRSDEHCGLLHVPGGAELYARAAQEHTTTARTPEELHELGQQLCAQLREEFEGLGERVFGTHSFDEVTDRLRHDRGLRYESRQQIEADARGALDRAEQVLPQWFSTWHQAPCQVEPIADIEAPDAVLGYYQPPAASEGRPGRHWINTWQPETRTRYEYEALAFHESVPGHHLQLALSQEMDLPRFRKYGYVTAFSEGWALYTERLADEMGLYSSDLARFGMLSFDAWRACRLVVDTGMHALGWSRQRAIEFMTAHSALTAENIVNEVDRYIAWPGQALAYMSGRLEIDRLRGEAEQALGPAFDVKIFHDVVLGNGGVPLAVLDAQVRRWVEATAT
jgi:uncharacterized protein (DUF885 family)